MKYLVFLTLISAILLAFNSCGDDTVNNGNINISNTDFDIYTFKINSSLMRFESYVIKENGTGFRLFNDSMAVLSSSLSDRIIIGKVDASGFSYASVYSATHNGTGFINIPIAGYHPGYFDITADGEKGLFTTDAGNYLCVFNTDGSGLIQISDGIRGTEYVPKFSPNGRLIAYFEVTPNFETGLYIISPDSAYKKQLRDSIFYSNGFTLDWSPDGSKIVYQSRKSNLLESQINVIDTLGNNVEIVAGGNSPQWSPNGSKISFRSNSTSGAPDLFLVNPDGTENWNITNSPGIIESNGRWSRDSDKLIFTKQYSGYLSLYLYILSNNTQVFLADSVYGGVWK